MLKSGIKVNEHVIYPGQGLAIVTGLVTKDLGEAEAKFYKLVFPYNKNMEILVPEDRIAECGIRTLSKSSEIKKALQVLKEAPKEETECGVMAPTTWKKRQRQYREMIDGGRLTDVASIYRDLVHTSTKKELSFGEKDMMNKAEGLMSQEIYAARLLKGEMDDVVSNIRMAVQPQETTAEESV